MEVTWRTWRSNGGGWWATRLGALTDQQLKDGLAMTLAADSEDDLDKLISEQAVKQQAHGGSE